MASHGLKLFVAAYALSVCGAREACALGTPQTLENEAVAESINHMFATELGSGVYDLGGRTLQVYRFTWNNYLRTPDDDTMGVRFILPATFGFFDFKPIDVLEEGPPERIDSFSVKPGFEFVFDVRDGWQLVPFASAGFSLASSNVEGWLYSAGARADRRVMLGDWDSLVRIEFSYAGVEYRNDTPNDNFVRLRQGVDFTRGLHVSTRGYEFELGLYGILDVMLDPPTLPVVHGDSERVHFEAGFTLATRPRVKLWKFDAPRLGFGYRFAGDISGWRFVIGAPF